MISHLNVRNYIDWAREYFEISFEDKILGTAPFHFDMSTFDVHCPPSVGAALCIAPDNFPLFPVKLLEFMEQHETTIWKGISSLLMYLARTGALAPDRMPRMRSVLFAGEVLPTRYLIEWMETFPDKSFYNCYGPTEATGVSACYYVEEVPESPDESVPVGKAYGNNEIFLLSEDGTPPAQGEMGELCIKGSCLSPGYWNNPTATGESFFSNSGNGTRGKRFYRTGDLARVDDNGNFIYVCRKDNQVKYMGYRIELPEIEHALLSIDKVKDSAVILRNTEPSGFPQLIAFIELEDRTSVEEVTTRLRRKLPQYMMPRRFISVAGIPRSDRGKIDRQALSKLEIQLSASV
jgi:non-ribosomal peptide synthetase component F